MSDDKKQSFYALLMMGLMWAIAGCYFTTGDVAATRSRASTHLVMMGLI
ncbi:MAG: hypothetical protein KME31_19775 [Tolypothrix carrinoi HA7290-LM1]|jgi:hypothetical protein|nr:hypothetical protein [Tolypothrix carrinoi HA7290-LM1]